MDFRILGPLEVRNSIGEVPLGGRRQQRIMATLLVWGNQLVTATKLIDSVWPSAPPSTVRSQVNNCVAALRRTLVAAGLPAGALRRGPNGYVLGVDPAAFDRARFEDLVACARREARAGRRAEAAGGFRAAEALWRGPAIAGLADGVLEGEALRLEELRWQAIEGRVELELNLGRHHELLPEMIALTRTHPGRDRLQAVLMLALHRSGRTADALAAFDHLRHLMRTELGLEPSSRLQALRQAILTDDVGQLQAVPG